MKSHTIKAIIASIAAGLLLGACSLFTSGSANVGGPASLTITVASAAAKTIFAASSGGIGLYKATLSQGGGAVATQTSSGSTLGFSDLEPGVYTLAVQGLTADGATLIANASVELSLVSGNNIKSVTLAYATSGSGSLSYSVTWPSGIAVKKVDYAYCLMGANSLTQGEIADPTGSASISGLGLPCGDYFFRFSFLDTGGISLLAYTEIVQILPGLVSTGSRTLTSANFASVPEAPASLSAAQAYPGVTLSWSYGSDQLNTATGYAIQRSNDGGGTWTDLAAITDGATLSYTDTTVAAGVTYRYRLYATNAFGTSASVATAPFAEPSLSLSYATGSANYGRAPTDSTAYRPGDSATVAGNTATNPLGRINYSFSGWNGAAAGTGAGYAVGASLTFADASVTLYPAWTAVAPTITSASSFDVTEGSSVTGSFTCDQSGDLTWYVSSLPTAGNFYVGGTAKLASAGSVSPTSWSYAPETGGVYNIDAADQKAWVVERVVTEGGYIMDPVTPTDSWITSCAYATMSVYVKNNDTGATSVSQTVTFMLTPVDDAPVMTMSTEPVVADSGFNLVTPTATDVDTPQSGLTYWIVDRLDSGHLYQYFDDASDDKTLISSANTMITDASGRFYYEPGLNYSSETIFVTIKVEAYDGEKYSAPETLTFEVTPYNY